MSNIKEQHSNWKIWIIKKLLSNKSNKEEILNFIANESNDYKDVNDNNENNLIKNILKLGEKSVEDIMVPRSEIVAVDHDKNYHEILEIIKTESHSRMPVFKKNLDSVIGFFHIKDFMKSSKNNFQMNALLRDILYVAPKSPILDLLKEMRSSRIHIGLVVDGIGGVDGLVTIEDLVEEIVGDIEDEHDADDQDHLILKKSNNFLEVDAAFRIEELEKFFRIEIDIEKKEEIETVGGLVFAQINRVPKNNEIIEIDDLLQIKILKSSDRKIETVEIKKQNN